MDRPRDLRATTSRLLRLGIEPTPYDEGRFQAQRVCYRPTDSLENRLERARASRTSLLTRIFLRSRRSFLDGFISQLEDELRQRQRTSPGG